jgi:hypothetical protein
MVFINKAYEDVGKKFINLFTYKWQKLLILKLVMMILNGEGINDIVVLLSTGHGKSIIIHILAEVLCYMEFDKVKIVCLNEYLSTFAINTYCEDELPSNYTDGKLEYLSLDDFLNKDPETVTDPDIHELIIYDEIDSMIG